MPFLESTSHWWEIPSENLTRMSSYWNPEFDWSILIHLLVSLSIQKAFDAGSQPLPWITKFLLFFWLSLEILCEHHSSNWVEGLSCDYAYLLSFLSYSSNFCLLVQRRCWIFFGVFFARNSSFISKLPLFPPMKTSVLISFFTAPLPDWRSFDICEIIVPTMLSIP